MGENTFIHSMNTLAIDTCEPRGSATVRVNRQCRVVKVHTEGEYSSWLLPAVECLLALAEKTFGDLDLLAVATGPGSFTGVRVGLCTVKAWAEVYGTNVVGVSRLEALARCVPEDGWVAASYNAQRGQIFGGLYRKTSGQLEPADVEMVVTPDDFLALVRQQTGGARVHWVSLDPNLFCNLPSGENLEAEGYKVWPCQAALANTIGEIAEEKAARGQFTDVLALDANYVRRSDAEIFWKGPAYRVG